MTIVPIYQYWRFTHVHHTYCPINLHYDMPNSVVRTNCSIKARNPTGSSMTPICAQADALYLTKFPMVCLIQMKCLLYHKQFSNTYLHTQVPIQVSNKIHMYILQTCKEVFKPQSGYPGCRQTGSFDRCFGIA